MKDEANFNLDTVLSSSYLFKDPDQAEIIARIEVKKCYNKRVRKNKFIPGFHYVNSFLE